MELENVGRGDVAEKSAEFDQQGDRAKREDGQVMYFARCDASADVRGELAS
jgi:hypothetical protein